MQSRGSRARGGGTPWARRGGSRRDDDLVFALVLGNVAALGHEPRLELHRLVDLDDGVRHQLEPLLVVVEGLLGPRGNGRFVLPGVLRSNANGARSAKAASLPALYSSLTSSGG